MSKIITDDCMKSFISNHYGKTNISKIGDGTVTGAIDYLNKKLSLRRFLFIGDSWGTGMGLEDTSKSYQQLVKARLLRNNSNHEVALYASNGSGFTTTGNTFLDQLNTAYTEINQELSTFTESIKPKDVTDIIALGGINDKDSTYETVKSAVATFISNAKSKFPNAKIHIGCLGWSAIAHENNKIYTISYRAYKDQVPYSGACYIKGSEYCMHNYNYFQQDAYHPTLNGAIVIADFLTNYLLSGSASINTQPIPYSTLNVLFGGSDGNRPTVSLSNVQTMQQDGMITLTSTSHIYLNSNQINSGFTIERGVWKCIFNGDTKGCGYMTGHEYKAYGSKDRLAYMTTSCVFSITSDNGATKKSYPGLLALECNNENTEIRWNIRIDSSAEGDIYNVTEIAISPFTIVAPWYMC